MKVIGKRISILKKENLLSIVILPTTDKKKLTLLFLWILAWTTCGIIVFINYFKLLDENIKLFCTPNEPIQFSPKIVINNSFGFGGTNGTIVFRRI